ncbi:sensor histidine kinase [Bergeyella sp. RCAD1439]|uniref:sensor histidine kinase n=1 Tax=Bergeyella anatis TaxID=3113737 RepID=UPI002E19BB8B|nr:HAMP domain-containing sensor histidine kinase [Bergeyella sp. RCAD1439]
MKLTQYISLRFIGIAALMGLLSIPVFYVVLSKIMQENIDRNLDFQKQWLINQMRYTTPENFSKYNQDIAIQEVTEILRKSDRYTNRVLPDGRTNDLENHRILDFYKEVNGKTYHFKIKKSLLENQKILKTIAFLQLVFFSILFLALICINRLVRHRVWQPFYEVLGDLQKYRIDHHNFSVPKRSPVAEMNDLNASLADLVERNRVLYSAQKEFTENASHELQTPLAVIQNKLEMLLQTEPLTEQQVQYIEDIYHANQKLSKMNRGLLLLAKIENHQFERHCEVSLRRLCEKTLSDLQSLFGDKMLAVSSFYQTDKVVDANETLMQILLGNLLSNAFRYAPERGVLEVYLSEESLTVSNTAEGGALDESMLFRRFKSQGGHKDGNGLGLEISRKICGLYGWSLRYFFFEGCHRFTIKF